MNKIYMRFPGGKTKALTFSYDDGIGQDRRLVSIFVKYGMKGTFNINTGIYGTTPTEKGRLMLEECQNLYTPNGMEVASHTLSHHFVNKLPPIAQMHEVFDDVKNIQEQYGVRVLGGAYPYGVYDDHTISLLKESGLLYYRTVVSTKNFDIPKDWLLLPATCHHNEPTLMELAKKFKEMATPFDPKMFYVWGHSYEFDRNDNWNVIEEFCECMQGDENIWYATNGEIFEYTRDYKRLEFTMDLTKVYNPTARTLFLVAENKLFEIPSGQTVSLI